jgi:hypothetical protein
MGCPNQRLILVVISSVVAVIAISVAIYGFSTYHLYVAPLVAADVTLLAAGVVIVFDTIALMCVRDPRGNSADPNVTALL